jgi:hypothetical protein
MLNVSRPGKTVGDPPNDFGQARNDLDPDESNIFGPDAPNVREDDPPDGQVVTEVEPTKIPDAPLDYGDFAPDEG